MGGAVIDSPIGKLLLEEHNDKLTKCWPTKKKISKKIDSKFLILVSKSIQDYFLGKKDSLNKIPLAIDGTEFQIAVLKNIKKIKPGKTKSYSELAVSIKREKAVRAVGTACGRNPLLLFVPCHRVLAKNNKLGGFSAGIERKRLLLEHEGVYWKKERASRRGAE